MCKQSPKKEAEKEASHLMVAVGENQMGHTEQEFERAKQV